MHVAAASRPPAGRLMAQVAQFLSRHRCLIRPGDSSRTGYHKYVKAIRRKAITQGPDRYHRSGFWIHSLLSERGRFNAGLIVKTSSMGDVLHTLPALTTDATRLFEDSI